MHCWTIRTVLLQMLIHILLWVAVGSCSLCPRVRVLLRLIWTCVIVRCWKCSSICSMIFHMLCNHSSTIVVAQRQLCRLHSHEMTKPFYSLYFHVIYARYCSDHFSDVIISYTPLSGYIYSQRLCYYCTCVCVCYFLNSFTNRGFSISNRSRQTCTMIFVQFKQSFQSLHSW